MLLPKCAGLWRTEVFTNVFIYLAFVYLMQLLELHSVMYGVLECSDVFVLLCFVLCADSPD